jgi:hypothetical protein
MDTVVRTRLFPNQLMDISARTITTNHVEAMNTNPQHGKVVAAFP